MTVTSSQFRTDFPAFTDTTKYPDTAVNMWLNIANANLDPVAWGTMLNLGVELWTAHNLVLDAAAAATVAAGGIAGDVSGPMNSQSIDKVSVGYDTGAVIIEGGADYNATMYGIRYLRLANQIGSGGLQF